MLTSTEEDFRRLHSDLLAARATIITLQHLIDTMAWDRDHDPLTGLLSRAGLSGTWAQLVANGRPPAGLALADLDGFKAVNDTYGHDAGDEILRAVGEALTRTHTGLAGRWSGDEFAIIITDQAPDWSDHGDPLVHAGRILEAVFAGISVAGISIPGASIGLARATIPPACSCCHGTGQGGGRDGRCDCCQATGRDPDSPDTIDPSVLMARADAAMYHAKRTGRHGWAIWCPDGTPALEPVAPGRRAHRDRARKVPTW